jgi:erythromycin esterase-like protein
MSFIQRQKKEIGIDETTRVVVWAHNSHVGDARATGYYKTSGQNSLGQLCRQEFGKEKVYSVGFSTYGGQVRAARQEGGSDEIMQLKPIMKDSHEYVLHLIAKNRGQDAFGYALRSNSSPTSGSKVDQAARELLSAERAERFVGSSYLPETEYQSHYSVCNMSEQFDFILHVENSTALRVHKSTLMLQDDCTL